MGMDLLQRSRFLRPLKSMFDDDVNDWFVGFDKMMDDLATKWDHALDGFSKLPKSIVDQIDEGHYKIEIETPGFAKDQLSVRVIGDQLVVEGVVDEKSEEKDRKEHRHESFVQRFLLAEGMAVDSAKLENGELHIAVTVPVPPQPGVKEIAIT